MTIDEEVKHFKRSLGLIHGNHVTSLVDSQESEVVNSLESTIGLPLGVGGLLEFLLFAPLEFMGPLFTTSPVANEILVTRVNEDLNTLR